MADFAGVFSILELLVVAADVSAADAGGQQPEGQQEEQASGRSRQTAPERECEPGVAHHQRWHRAAVSS